MNSRRGLSPRLSVFVASFSTISAFFRNSRAYADYCLQLSRSLKVFHRHTLEAMSLLSIVLSRIDIQKNISSLGSISLPWTTSDVKVHRLCKCSILTVPFKANDMKLVDFFYFLWIRHSGRICLIACYWVGQIFRASMLKFPFWKLEEQIFWIHSLKFSVHLAQKLIYLFFLWNARKANFFNLPFQVVLSETNERTKETRIAHRLDRPLVKRLMGPQGHICKFYCWKIIWDLRWRFGKCQRRKL